MTNGAVIKMSKGKLTRVFWLFVDGTAEEYIEKGTKDIDDFTAFYKSLQNDGWKEI